MFFSASTNLSDPDNKRVINNNDNSSGGGGDGRSTQVYARACA